MVGCGKGSCILHHWGIQLILAYSWARPTILIVGKDRGGISISSVSSLSFLFLFLPCPSLSSPLLSLLPFSGRRHKMTSRIDMSLNPNTIKSSPYDNLSKHQRIFTKLGMCIDIVEVWFGIANWQTSSFFFDRVICPPHIHIFFSGQ